MRLMLRFSIPAERGNKAFADGSLGAAIEKLISDTKAEAAYFTAVDGQPEPLFAALDAKIEITPVMSADELKRGLAG